MAGRQQRRPSTVGDIGSSTARRSGSAVTARFAETEPLSTYLFSFVVGDFKVETAERNGRTFRMFHRETDAAKVARNKDAIFDLHAPRARASWRTTPASPTPSASSTSWPIPAFQFGGMEHAGKILYNATGLLLDESATQNQFLGRASVIAHETAHMWFGDLVTMRWFNDVWMKEVFANFMAAKIVNPSFPEVNHDLRFLYAHYPAAYEVDRTAGANAIRQPLANLNEAGSLYGAIIYQKAPVVMRHLEHLLGAESFRDGLREYLNAHTFGNATWTDLIAVLDGARPSTWRRGATCGWKPRAGPSSRPSSTSSRDGDASRRSRSRRATRRSAASCGRSSCGCVVALPDGPRTLEVALNGPRTVVTEAVGWPAPLYVLPNGGGWAYGGFVLDPASRDYLARERRRDSPTRSPAAPRGSRCGTRCSTGTCRRPPSWTRPSRPWPTEPDEQSRQRILATPAARGGGS